MLDGIQTDTCYCEIGAGGKPCRDRQHCDKFRAQTCRFNCRTAKENWMDGYVAALMHETSFSGGLYKLAEVAYDEWKRRQA